MPTKEEIIAALEAELDSCERLGKERRAKEIREQLAALKGQAKPAAKAKRAEKRG